MTRAGFLGSLFGNSICQLLSISNHDQRLKDVNKAVGFFYSMRPSVAVTPALARGERRRIPRCHLAAWLKLSGPAKWRTAQSIYTCVYSPRFHLRRFATSCTTDSQQVVQMQINEDQSSSTTGRIVRLHSPRGSIYGTYCSATICHCMFWLGVLPPFSLPLEVRDPHLTQYVTELYKRSCQMASESVGRF